jgi:hypothetical protein
MEHITSMMREDALVLDSILNCILVLTVPGDVGIDRVERLLAWTERSVVWTVEEPRLAIVEVESPCVRMTLRLRVPTERDLVG